MDVDFFNTNYTEKIENINCWNSHYFGLKCSSKEKINIMQTTTNTVTFSDIIQGQEFECQKTALSLQDIQKLSQKEVQTLSKDQINQLSPILKREIAKKLPLQNTWSMYQKNDEGLYEKIKTIDTIHAMWEGITTAWEILNSTDNSISFFRDVPTIPPRFRRKGHAKNQTKQIELPYIWGGHIKDHLINLNNGILLIIVLGIFGGDGFNKIYSIINSFNLSFVEKKFTIFISDPSKRIIVDEQIHELLNNEYGDYAMPYPKGDIGSTWIFGRPGHLNDDKKWIQAQNITEVDTWHQLVQVWDNEGFGNPNNQVFKGMKSLTFFKDGLAPSYELLGKKLGISSGKIMHMKWLYGRDEDGKPYPRLNMKVAYWHIIKYLIENEDKSIFGVELRNNDARFWITKDRNYEELYDKISNYLGNAINHMIRPKKFDYKKDLNEWKL